MIKKLNTLQQKKSLKEFRLPAIPAKYNKEYTTAAAGDSQSYEVNPHKLRCTCSDFLSTRKHYEQGDLRRNCCHINTQLKQLDLIRKMPALVKTVIDHVTPVHTTQITLTVKEKLNRIPVLIFIDKEGEWAEVLVKIADNNSKRYSYIIKETRWTLNDKPAFYEQIEKAVCNSMS